MSLEGKAVPGGILRGKINNCDLLTISAYGIAVKNGFHGTEQEWLASLNMNPAELDEAIARYLKQNPAGIDSTLTVSGQAADAKITGEAIAGAKKKAEDELNAHRNSKSNPHNVTASQVGLGNVNNTSDKDKPVSTAQASAIADAKKAGTDAKTAADNAQSTANNAQSAANNAQTTANSAITAAGNALTESKNYTDSKHMSVQTSVPASGWSASAPYTQSVSVSGLLATDQPHIGLVPNDNWEMALIQEENWGYVSRGVTENGSITFTCYEDKPEVNLPLQIEVNR